MSKNILDHHQIIADKLNNIGPVVVEPLNELLSPLENLVKVLKANADPKDIEVKENLISELKSLIEAAEQLDAKYNEEKTELEKIEQEGGHDDIDLEKEQENILHEKLKSLLAKGPWDQGKFFEGIKQNLQAICDNYEEMLGLKPKAKAAVPSDFAANEQVGSEESLEMNIFISLHNSRGGEQDAIKTWENLLLTIGRQVINRPIYAKEEDVQAFIRSAKDPNKEAYVCAVILKRNLMAPPGGVDLLDREGRKLLTVKEGTVSREDVQRFVHISGTYQYQKDKLVRIDDPGNISSSAVG